MIVAILLQWTLRNVSESFAYIDFPLIIVVYAALQRNSIRAILFGTISGIAMDALSGGLLGANGFTKTLVAYIVSEIARRVYMDNLLLRIPVLAGACLLNSFVYFGLHKLLGQSPSGDLVVIAAYSLIGTTIAGTLVYLFLKVLERKKPGRENAKCSRLDGKRDGETRYVLTNKNEDRRSYSEFGIEGQRNSGCCFYSTDAFGRAALLSPGCQRRIFQRTGREPACSAHSDSCASRSDLRPQRQAAGRFAADLQRRSLERTPKIR